MRNLSSKRRAAFAEAVSARSCVQPRALPDRENPCYSLLLRLLCSCILGVRHDTDQAAKRGSRFSGRLPEQAWVLAELRGDCPLFEADFAGHGAQAHHDAGTQRIRPAWLQPEPVN